MSEEVRPLERPLPTEAPSFAQRWAWAMALTAVITYSLNAPVGRAAFLEGINPTFLLIGRFFFSSLLLGITLAVREPHKLRLDGQGIRTSLLMGVLGAGSTLCYYWGISRMTASIAAMIVSLYPLVVLLTLTLRGEKLTGRNIARLVLGLGGVYLLIGPGGQVDGFGVLLLMGTVFGYALYLVLAQWYLTGYHVMTISFYIDGVMFVVMLLFGLFQGIELALPSSRGLFLMLTLAILGTYVARSLMLSAIRYIGSGQAALLAPMETMLTVLWSVIFLAERMSVLQWLGGLLILSSTLLVFQHRPRWIKLRLRRPAR